MLHDLEILPTGLWLLVRRRPTLTRVFGHLAPRLDHRFSVAALTVRCYRWRSMWVTTSLELFHQVCCHFTLVFANRSAYSQARVHVYRRAAPEGASLVFFLVSPFLPLLPT